MRRICVVLTARASYARAKTVLEAIDAHPDLDLQYFDLWSDPKGPVLLRNDGSTGSMVENAAEVARYLRIQFSSDPPDAVVTVADRHETLGTAIAASYMNIPLVHLLGGEVSGSIDDKVRNAVTQLADYHFVATKEAAARAGQKILDFGRVPVHYGQPDPDFRMELEMPTVKVTGCPSIDLAARAVMQFRGLMPELVGGEASGKSIFRYLGFSPYERYPGIGTEFDLKRDFIVVMFHPNTTEHDEAAWQTEQLIKAVWDIGMPAFWFWPNADAGADAVSKAIRVALNQNRIAGCYFLKNMAPEDFYKLLLASKCLVGNSSVGIRECSYLEVPVVNIGTRQQGREHGENVLHCGYEAGKILGAVQTVLGPHRDAYTSGRGTSIYGDGHAGERIAKLLAEVDL